MSNATATARAATARTAPVRLPQPRREAPRLHVVTGDEARRSNTAFTVLCAALMGLGLLALLLLNTARAEQSFALGNLNQASTTLGDNQEQLRSDISSVSAPQQVALKAQEMGMVPAGQIAYIRKSDGKVLGVASRAAAGTPFTVGTLPDTPASGVADRAVAAASSGVLVHKPAPKPSAASTAPSAATPKPSSGAATKKKAAPTTKDAQSTQSQPKSRGATPTGPAKPAASATPAR